MLNKQRSKRILAISLPIIGGMFSQNILNLVDSAMVGSLSATALAAVGLGGFINFMSVAFFIGFGAGVQALVSRRIGEGKIKHSASPLNAAIFIIVLTAPIASVGLYFASPWLLQLINSDPAVIEQGVPYLQARFLGVVFLGLHFSFRGFWSGIDQTGIYLKALLIAHSCNILISYVLIFGKFGFPALGTFGAGLGTSISMAIAVLYYMYCALDKRESHGFLRYKPNKKTLKQVFKTAMPASLQQFFFAAGFTVMLLIVGKIGTAELAGANIILSLMLVGVLPALGFGIGGATLVGHSLGKNNVDAAHQWGWDAVKLAAMVVLVLMAPVVLFPEMILAVFLHDASVIELTRLPLQLAGFALVFESIGIVLFNTINGAGDTKRTMLASFVLQWLLFLPAAWYVGPFLGQGLIAIWLVYIGYRIILTITLINMWQGKKWSTVVV